MLSIFEQKEFERQPEKKLTLNRLQNVLGPQAPAPGTGTSTVAAIAEPSAPATPPPEPAFAERRPILRPPEPPAAPPPAAALETATVQIPAELQSFADQFTRGFREVLVNTVRDIQAPMAEDHRKMESVSDHLAKTTREVESLHSDVNSAYERIDSLGKMLQDLATRLGKLEDSVNIANAAAHAIQDSQQALEKRLELQAGVIRSLHASAQSREERLDKILSTFQALQGVSAERVNRRSLPEDL
ncbi:MAG: hypothetical protein ACE141_12540 [Bryobacteraceae bacterium]